MSNTEYLSCAKTAQLVRAALKRNFPDQVFSVRSHVYSGGASIRVNWHGGPEAKAVEAIAAQYSGGRFDGSIDMAYHVDHWLNPDGTVLIARNPGSAGSGGYDAGGSNDKPHPDARLVSFGANYIFCTRDRAAAEAA